MPKLGVVVASHDAAILGSNFLRSKFAIEHPGACEVVTGFKNVPMALNVGAGRLSRYEYLAFIHHDVVLPDDWEERVLASIEKLPKNWRVCGPSGVDKKGTPWGHLTNCGEEWGSPDFEDGVKVQTLDEVCLIINTGNFVSTRVQDIFDEHNPTQHFYGADLCLRNLGRVHVIHAPLEHNRNRPMNELDFGFFLSMGWIYGKHRNKLPIWTTCCKIELRDHILRPTI